MFLSALLATTGAPAPIEIVLRGPAPTCTVAIAGQTVTREELENIVRRSVTRQPRVIVRIADPYPDYRCLGGIVYIVQQACPAGIAPMVDVATAVPRGKP